MIPVQINRYKRRWDGEVVHKRVEFQHEPKLVRGSDELNRRNKMLKMKIWITMCYPNEEVNHEENIEC